MLIRELNQSILRLKGVGKTLAAAFRSQGISTMADLLLHIPRDYEDHVTQRPLFQGKPAGERYIVNTVITTMAQDYIGWGEKKTLKVYIKDDSATAALVCFGRNFLDKQLAPGKRLQIYGTFQYQYGEIQSSSFEISPYAQDSPQAILPVYPLAGAQTQKVVRKLMKQALNLYGQYVDDELPAYIQAKHHCLSKKEALANLHFPGSFSTLDSARKSLIFEELFYLQLLILRRGEKRKQQFRDKRTLSLSLQKSLISSLPFDLTEDQKTVMNQINGDLTSPRPMARLLQGEVGSGKTLVAFLSALIMIEAGFQVAFMAPTELLARQHADNALKLLAPLNIRLGFLSGNIKSESRKQLLAALKNGEIDLLIGTHALFTAGVSFRDLGLVIVDEQHRFGVLQRIALMDKGELPDLLVMTATPIPRTLALTAFGDLDISTIKTMPQGRKAVITHLAKEGNEQKVYERVRREIRQGRQAYFIYPLIRKSEKMDLKDTETMYAFLRAQVFPDLRLGLIHSQIEETAKEKTMEDFIAGKINILVATSVIEVGVDVANATCIVIEHAERFGLSALHQLRGRVGRGPDQAYAFLIYSTSLNEDGKKRLKVMKESHDGFYISEEDLKIRGPGEIAGARQSGFARLTIANLMRDIALLKQAREEAQTVLKQDAGLLAPEHQTIRAVLSKAPPFSAKMLDGG